MDSSCAFAIVPLCATQRSFTFNGCAFAKVLVPIVEYLTCPITQGDAYSCAIFLNSDEECETNPTFLNGGLLGTANPQASCPLCCKARNASNTIGTTFLPERL